MTNHNRMLSSLVGNAMISPRTPLKGRDAIEQMADDMRVAHTRNGGVTEADLALIGWTGAQIAAHGNAARERAMKLANGA